MSGLRIGIQGWGSEGDVRPLIALAARLRREGHAPSVVLTPIDARDYRAECRVLDVPLRVVPEEIGFSLEALVEGARSSDPSKLSRAVLNLGFTPHLEAMYAAAIDLCGQSDVAGLQPHGTSRTVFFAGSWDHPFCRQKGPPAGEG
jgi:UDP:flavonoid glycosyltransferase YjiC (YdhE family)